MPPPGQFASGNRLAAALAVSLGAHGGLLLLVAAVLWLGGGAQAGAPSTPGRAFSPVALVGRTLQAPLGAAAFGDDTTPLAAASAAVAVPPPAPWLGPGVKAVPATTASVTQPRGDAAPAADVVVTPAPELGGSPGTAGGVGMQEAAAGGGGGAAAGGGGTAAGGVGSGAGVDAATCWQGVADVLSERAKRGLPRAVAARGLAGTVVLRFAVDATGQARDIVVEMSSGQPLLDAAARALLATPFAHGCPHRGRWPVRFLAQP